MTTKEEMTNPIVGDTETVVQSASSVPPVRAKDLEEVIHMDYADGDIYFADGFHGVPEELVAGREYKLEIMLFLVCLKGRAHVRIKSKEYTVRENEILCCAPGTTVSDYMVSPDFEASMLCVTEPLMKSLLRNDKNIWHHIYRVSRDPVIHVSERFSELFSQYKALVKSRHTAIHHAYRKDAMTFTLGAAFYDLLGIVDEQVRQSEKEEQMNSSMSQEDHLLRRFIELLEKTYPRERTISYYSDQLCITPKYLSSMVKRASGKTALEWINAYVADDIREKLTYTDMSIKEIAYTLKFPTLSFFGKYVKRQLGVSPSAFRVSENRRLAGKGKLE